MALTPPKDRDGFEIAIVCALTLERDAVEALMDLDFKEKGRTYGKAAQDRNAYTTGVLGGKPVVLAYPRDMGTLNAATVTGEMRYSFRNIKIALVVRVAGGAPYTPDGGDILLGDILISTQVVQYDFGRQYSDGFKRRNEVESTLGRASTEIANFIQYLRGARVKQRLLSKIEAGKAGPLLAVNTAGEDRLFPSDYRHKHRGAHECEKCSKCTQWYDPVCEQAEKAICEDVGCDREISLRRQASVPEAEREGDEQARALRTPSIHFGRVASGSGVMKSGIHRDQVMAVEKVIGFEMEGAGTWDQLPTVVVKSVCDYADSHKNKGWQKYAAAMAASCAKAMLEEWETSDRPNTGSGQQLTSM